MSSPGGDFGAVADPDGSVLLASPEVADLLHAAVDHGGGTLVSWRLDHIDAQPGHATTATYAAVVDWPFGRREELLGASARVGDRTRTDERAVIFADGAREVAVWLYPNDPDLPGLPRTASTPAVAALLNEHAVVPYRVSAEQIDLETIGYRPRRRAVLRVVVHGPPGRLVLYVKVMRQAVFAATVRRHELLLGAGVPAPQIAAATPDFLLILRELPGRPLATAIFDPVIPCRAEDLVTLLDAMPPEIAALPRRLPWVDAVDQYAAMVAAALPPVADRLGALTAAIHTGLASTPPGPSRRTATSTRDSCW